MTPQLTPVTEINVAIGNKIKAIRKLRGINQDELAELMGLTRTSIVNIEAGRQGLPAKNIWNLCEKLKISVIDIFPESTWDKDLIMASKIKELEEDRNSWRQKYTELTNNLKSIQTHLKY